jgi:hypothetical protein
MCGIRFRVFDTVCARVLTTFRRTPCPHIPYDWIITTAKQGSQKLTATLLSSKVSPTLSTADKDFKFFHLIQNTWVKILS